MKVNIELISKLETLAKLKLSETEKHELMGELDKIIDMFSMIEAVDTENVEPLIHINEVENIHRDDLPGQHLDIKAFESNAPKMKDNMFAVPKVIEQ
jgi:aspartyl-tRNA(Asn)/glutamyl-tRNA(Gln) amidotransferase subunit C